MSWFDKDKGYTNRFDHVQVGGNINLVQGSGSIVTEAKRNTIDYEALAKELQNLCQRDGVSDADYLAFSRTADAVRQQNESVIREKIKQFAASFSTEVFIQCASAALMQFIQTRMGK